jgi:hypothetical protein
MHALVGNLIQLGMLGLGVSLLLVCINYLKPGAGQKSYEEADGGDAEALAASAARNRTGP